MTRQDLDTIAALSDVQIVPLTCVQLSALEAHIAQANAADKRIEDATKAHDAAMVVRDAELATLKADHATALKAKDDEKTAAIAAKDAAHSAALTAKDAEKAAVANELNAKTADVAELTATLQAATSHAAEIIVAKDAEKAQAITDAAADKAAALAALATKHATAISKKDARIADLQVYDSTFQADVKARKIAELTADKQAAIQKQAQIDKELADLAKIANLKELSELVGV